MPGAQQFAHLGGQLVPAGQLLPVRGEQAGLLRKPPIPFGTLVFHPSVGVTDLMTADVLGEIEPARRRIPQLRQDFLPVPMQALYGLRQLVFL